MRFAHLPLIIQCAIVGATVSVGLATLPLTLRWALGLPGLSW